MIQAADGFGMGVLMRGREGGSDSLFSHVRLEERVLSDHPLCAIRGWQMKFRRG